MIVEDLESAAQGVYDMLVEIMALETYQVWGYHDVLVSYADHDHKWRDIFGGPRHSAQKGVAADADELVNGGGAADDGVLAYMHVTGQHGVTRQYHPMLKSAIMGHMDRGHNQAIIADPRASSPAFGAAVDGGALSDGHPIAYDQRGLFTGVFHVLGVGADGGEGKHSALSTDDGIFINIDMAHDLSIRPNFDPGTNYGVRAYGGRLVDL
jgi:hypothetical protein